MRENSGVGSTGDKAEGLQRYLNDLATFRLFAAVGAFIAAIAPAVMATADDTVLRGSVSDYWNLEPNYYFWLPFTLAAGFLLLDALFSYVPVYRRAFGGRWYNVVLGLALLGLTWFDIENEPGIHYPAAWVFFLLFIAVIAYTSALGWRGRHIEQPGNSHNRQLEIITAQVSLVFLGLLALSLLAWLTGLIAFFFFEMFALVNFSLYYIQGSVKPFPYTHYEFESKRLNSLLRFFFIMKRRS